MFLNFINCLKLDTNCCTNRVPPKGNIEYFVIFQDTLVIFSGGVPVKMSFKYSPNRLTDLQHSAAHFEHNTHKRVKLYYSVFVLQ